MAALPDELGGRFSGQALASQPAFIQAEKKMQKKIIFVTAAATTTNCSPPRPNSRNKSGPERVLSSVPSNENAHTAFGLRSANPS
jgi:hypothetical protein